MEEYGTEYIRGRVSQIYPDGNGQMTVMGVDTLLGQPVEIKADLVVLAVGVEANRSALNWQKKNCTLLRQLRLLHGKPRQLKPVKPTPPVCIWRAWW